MTPLQAEAIIARMDQSAAELQMYEHLWLEREGLPAMQPSRLYLRALGQGLVVKHFPHPSQGGAHPQSWMGEDGSLYTRPTKRASLERRVALPFQPLPLSRYVPGDTPGPAYSIRASRQGYRVPPESVMLYDQRRIEQLRYYKTAPPYIYQAFLRRQTPALLVQLWEYAPSVIEQALDLIPLRVLGLAWECSVRPDPARLQHRGKWVPWEEVLSYHVHRPHLRGWAGFGEWYTRWA